jgi:survival-of-motor-neuron-related-splicing factor 30
MAAAGLQSPEELQATLSQYREQLAQVEALLMLGNDEEMPAQDLQDMYTSLAEVRTRVRARYSCR